MKEFLLLMASCFLLSYCNAVKTTTTNPPVVITDSIPETSEPSDPIPIVSPDGFGSAALDYQKYCASCHGKEMEAFADQIVKWKHGTSKVEIIKSIKVGIVEEGMPAFAETFSNREIIDLANYIRNGIDEWEAEMPSEKEGQIFETENGRYRAELVSTAADIPWGMAFLPSGEMLITDRDGDMYLRKTDGTSVQIQNVPKVRSKNQGGLLDVELHPNYETNKWIYISYSKEKGDKATTAVIRTQLVGNQLVETQEIFEALPYWNTNYHYGSRLEFDNDGYLFITVGDRGKRDVNPQNLDNHCGKVHRIHDDGRIPDDNPFAEKANAKASIYSYGHRNPQGLIIDKKTGTIWEHEHGPRGGDELNIIKKGENYGWPVISYGINYNGTTFTDKTKMDGMLNPENYWVPSIAPCGMAQIEGEKYGDWEGDLLVASLRFNYLVRVIVKDDVVLGEEEIFKNIGRVRNVRMSPDGFIYVAVEDPGRIFKMVPMG